MNSKRPRRAKFVALLASTSGLLHCHAGYAQAQIDADDVAQREAAGAPAANEIVVTAQRRSELSRDVPISLIVLSGDELKRANVEQLADVAELTPGVRFQGASNFLQPSIRGVSTSLVGSGVGSNVGIYVDGFYSSTATGSNFSLLNVSNIQVLKGPQGTLFGRNTTGGAILVTTARPSLEPSATVEASYERFDARRLQAYVTNGVTDTLAIDLEGQYRRGDGYFRDILSRNGKVGAYEDWSVRTGLAWSPSAELSFLLRYQHTDTSDPTFVQTNALVRNGTPLTLAAIIPGAVIATRPRDVAPSATQPGYFSINSDTLQFTVQADLGFANLSSYTQYRDERTEAFSDLDFSAADIAYLSVPQSVKMFTQEFLLASKPGPALQWTIGAFYLNQKDSFPQSDLAISGGPFLLTAVTGLRTQSYAAFMDSTYELTEKLFITAGLRYTHEVGLDAFRFSGPLSGNLGLTEYPKLKRDYLTPRVVVRFKPSDKSSIYASVTRGSKAAIIDTNDSDPNARINPEKLTSYEAGFKYEARGFAVDLSAYYYDYKNLQVSIPIGSALLVRNAANSRIYGAEAQVRYDIGAGFSLSGGAAYNNAKYKNFVTSQIFVQCLDFAACGAGFGTFPNATSDSSGLRMQMAPRFTASLSPSYAAELQGGQLRLSGNLFYSASFYFDTSEQFRQPGYAKLDLRAEWTDPSDRYTLAVYGENVTDKRYLQQVTPNNFGIGALWAPPLSYGASIRAKF